MIFIYNQYKKRILKKLPNKLHVSLYAYKPTYYDTICYYEYITNYNCMWD